MSDQLCASVGMQAVRAYKREDFVGICGFSSLDWVTADFANTYCGECQEIERHPQKPHLLATPSQSFC